MEGKIVLIKVYFTDLSEYKIRPVLIFKRYEKFDYMFLPLTSNLNKKGIKISNKNLSEGKIDLDSIILIPKFGIVDKSLIIKELGKVNIEYLYKIGKIICEDFGCNFMT
ncbi:MAG: type II toxin-antitoxin system PemK/MazF family toxin [Candidatus Gracilibacteria bacterium]|nr:type II toxin-antitoxin system PemK/MazF family toxin [Candidatus Gracilibacteria bacterium]MDQ7022702.1 type II toxin-antitoxin system PemK/MazF family toxin [Candidatus Gracilibacteria bacterium]